MSKSGSKTEAAQDHPPSQYWPLYAAGFVTAFGAHSIAANLGAYGREHHATLLTVGLLLAIYEMARKSSSSRCSARSSTGSGHARCCLAD